MLDLFYQLPIVKWYRAFAVFLFLHYNLSSLSALSLANGNLSSSFVYISRIICNLSFLITDNFQFGLKFPKMYLSHSLFWAFQWNLLRYNFRSIRYCLLKRHFLLHWCPTFSIKSYNFWKAEATYSAIKWKKYSLTVSFFKKKSLFDLYTVCSIIEGTYIEGIFYIKKQKDFAKKH